MPVTTYSPRDLRIAGLLFISYLLVAALRAALLPGIGIVPEYAVAIVGMYFGGTRQWPVVLASAFITTALIGTSAIALIAIPLTSLAVAYSGAYLFRRFAIDPLLRHDRDATLLIAAIALPSLIAPTLSAIASALTNSPYTYALWLAQYASDFFTLFILLPFLLRWLVKPTFKRTFLRTLEILVLFAMLLLVDVLLFVQHTASWIGIPLTYFLFVPLFIISLRLRPRFVTLAMVVTSVVALAGLGASSAQTIFQTELFMIGLAVIFFIVTSLEEQRRVSASQFYSQVASLENAAQRLSSESRAKNDFIAILAHELRNPLAPVASGIELLRRRCGDDEEFSAILDPMENSMHTIRRLLDDLLDASRITEGKIMLEKQVIDLERSVRNAIRSTEHHRKEWHQDLECNLTHKKLYVYADPVRIEQVFSNLFTNASKYSGEGTTVTVEVKDEGGIALVSVADEGIGIERQELDSIFDPFRQLRHGERAKRGLGIGLSLVRDFVKLHGGTVKADSDGLGRGSTFFVRLPLFTPELRTSNATRAR